MTTTGAPAMNRAELKKIIADEGLVDALFLDEESIDEDAVVFEPRGSEWAVYLTIERATVVPATFRTFTDESEALEYMLLKLRQSARARELLAEDE
ncbi:hypothetical protein GCM10027426_15870 [Microbacterium lacusdiani]